MSAVSFNEFCKYALDFVQTHLDTVYYVTFCMFNSDVC